MRKRRNINSQSDKVAISATPSTIEANLGIDYTKLSIDDAIELQK
jgi:hypothetical protein